MAKEFKKVKVLDPDFGKREPEREQDALIDQRIFGHETNWALWGNREMPFRKGWHDHGMPFSVPYYHTEIRDAMLIVEELRQRGVELSLKSIAPLDPQANNCEEIIALHNQGLKYCVQWWDKEDQRYEPAVYGRIDAEAICKAIRDHDIPKK